MADHRFDDEVLGPIIGRDADDPAMLWELLSSVDAVHQTFIGPDDLNETLGRLAAAHLVRELPGHRYVDGTAGAGSRVMAPVTLVRVGGGGGRVPARVRPAQCRSERALSATPGGLSHRRGGRADGCRHRARTRPARRADRRACRWRASRR